MTYEEFENKETRGICKECSEPMKETGTYFILDYKTNGAKVIRRVPTLECINCGHEWIWGNAKIRS